MRRKGKTKGKSFQICAKHFFKILSSDPKVLNLCVTQLLKDCSLHKDDRLLAYLSKLLSQPIWRRIWILQEFQSGREVVLVSEEGSIDLEKFSRLWTVLYLHSESIPHPGNDPRNNRMFRKLKEAARFIAPMLLQSSVLKDQDSSRSLLELLRATRNFNASDPRDRIYALLGISSDGGQLGILPDYSSSYEEVCVKLTKALIRKYGTSVLSFNAGCNISLPSWCCDFSIPSQFTIVTDRPTQNTNFSASGQLPPTIAFSDVSDTLALSVVWIGSVNSLSAIAIDELHGTSETRVRQLFLDLQRHSREIALSETNDLWTEEALFCIPIAFQKPLVQKTGSVFLNAPQELVDAFQTLRSGAEASSHIMEASAKLNQYVQEVSKRAPGKNLFSCDDRYLGLGPKDMREGDLVALIMGAEVPYVLRDQKNGSFRLIGEAYVHDIMYGEFMRRSEPVLHQIMLE